MPLFTAEELARIREDMDRLLPDTCTVNIVTLASEGEGGSQETLTPTATNIPCRFAMLTGVELERAGQVAAGADCVVTLTATTAVTGTGRITITNADPVPTNYVVEVVHVVKRSQEFTRRVYGKLLSP